MRRYLFRVRRFNSDSFNEGSIDYDVYDRLTGKTFKGYDYVDAFMDYPGTIQELANDMEIEDVVPILGVYGDRYMVTKANDRPYLYLELNDKGRRERERVAHKKLIWTAACLGG